jgi:type II secretory pathway pseudopilin PulG
MGSIQMNTPNWKHHSKKEKKRKLKPQAMRARREALRHFKKRHMGRPKGDLSFYHSSIRNEVHEHPPRNQVSTCQTACY